MRPKVTAIVLAAGKGSRMGTKTKKQYLELVGKPILYYSLKTFADSSLIDEIILVTAYEDVDYCHKEYQMTYKIPKLTKIIAGGKERQDSVFQGLQACQDSDYVMIHDGARPFVDLEMIQRIYDKVVECDACIAAVHSKDTVKIVGEDGVVVDTPERKYVWNVQTPQAFSFSLIKKAHEGLKADGNIKVTDDAMAIELMTDQKVYVVEGSYSNIKITTPEDLYIADRIIKQLQIKM